MNLIPIIIGLPLLGLLLIPTLKSSKPLFYLSNSFLAILGFILLITSNHKEHPYFKYHDVTLFFFDDYSWFFSILVYIGWFITLVYSYSFDKYEFQDKKAKFHFYLLITLSVVLANGLSGNPATLLVFYVLGTFTIYPLITIGMNDHVWSVGRFYLRSMIIPIVFILTPAFFILYYISGSINFTDHIHLELQQHKTLSAILIGLFVIGFSKNAIFPFNSWLPKTSVAPAPVSGLIHSIAAVNTGTIAIIKIVVYIFGLDFIHTLTSDFFTGGYLFYITGLTAVYAAYKALKTSDLKERFAYSTVSQMSYIVAGILTGTKLALLGATLHMMTHAFAKIGLIYNAGIFNCLYGTTKGPEIAKILPHKKWIGLLSTYFGLSISGIPFLAGYYSKDLILLEELHEHHYAGALFLLIGSFINLLYIYPIMKGTFFYIEKVEIEQKPVPIGMATAVILCTLLLLAFTFFSSEILSYFKIEIGL